MSEAVAKPVAVKYANPFIRRTKHAAAVKFNDPNVIRIKSVNVDKKTMLVSPVYETINTQAEIQACADLCGIVYMKKLLASGQVSAEDLADTKPTSFDSSVIPVDVHTARRLADKANAQIAAAIQASGGIEGEVYSADQVERMLTQAVKLAFEQQKAAQPAATDGGNN